MNSFKGLEPVNSMPEELWTEVCNIVQKAVNKLTPTRRQSGYLKRKSESKGERERYIQLNAEFQRMARRDKKDFFNE